MKQKLLALVCALALVVSLAGCVISTPDTVGSLGDYEISSGLYLLAQYDAYQKAADLASSDQDAANVKAFLKQTITVDSDSGETATVSDYVARKTLENLQTYAATELRFDELGGQLTAEEEQQADSYAQQLMDQYGDTYTANGIGLETVKAYERLQVEHTALLDMVYGPDGETPVEDDELTSLDGLDHAGLGDASVGEQLGGLGRKLTKGAGLVGVAGILNLVEQLGQDDGAHDGVVIGVLVTKDKNVCHGYPPLDMCTWT